MSRIAKITLLIIVVGIIPCAAPAQDVDTTLKSELEQVLGQFKKNEFIIVHSLNSGKARGKIKFIDNDTLFLSRRNKVTSVLTSQVDSVWTVKSSPYTSVIIGCGFGLITGAAIGFAFRHDIAIFGEGAYHPERIYIGAAVGAVFGTVIGAAVGAPFTTGELQYARPKSQAQEPTDVSNNVSARRLRLNVSPDLNGGVAVKASVSF